MNENNDRFSINKHIKWNTKSDLLWIAYSLPTPSKALRRAQFGVKDALADPEGGKPKGRGKGKGRGRGKGRGKAKVKEGEEKQEEKEVEGNESEGKVDAKPKGAKTTRKSLPSNGVEPSVPLPPKKRPYNRKNNENEVAEASAGSEIPKGGKRLKGGKEKDEETPADAALKRKQKATKDMKDNKKPRKPVGEATTFARRYQPTSFLGRAKWEALREAFSIYIKPALAHYSAHEDPPNFFVFCCARECQNHPMPEPSRTTCFVHVYGSKWSIFNIVVISNYVDLPELLL